MQKNNQEQSKTQSSKDGLRILNFKSRLERVHKTAFYISPSNCRCYHPSLPRVSLSLMGNAPIAPRDRHILASIPEVSSSHDPVSEKYVNANANELESTQDKTARYLPKAIILSSNAGVSMPSRPYDSGGSFNAGGTESPQWGWYVNIPSPITEMHHSGSRLLRHNTQSSTRYLPKGMKRGVIMPSKPYGCGGASTAGDNEGSQWDWSISVSPPATAMYHRGSRSFPKKPDSSANASQTLSGMEISTNYQPNRIFQDMQKGASIGWASVPL